MHPLTVVVLLLLGCAGVVCPAAEVAPNRVSRSHIQPVGEVAATERQSPAIGLVTARAPAVLREQLRLERGAGLVVESVTAGSVAERAGLQRHDVLVSIDGQFLLLPEQLQTFLEASDGDAPLACRLIRGGSEQTISLRADAVAVAKSEPARRAAGALKPAESVLKLVPRKSAEPEPKVAVQKSSTAVAVPLPGGGVQQRDADYAIKLTGGSETRLLVRDARGRIVFNGAIDTPEQRSLVPPAVRSRVAGLEQLLAQQQQSARPPVAATAATMPTMPTPKTTPSQPTSDAKVRIGTLDISPVEVR